ncbi:hypothetical protein HN789_03620 [archaeon]|nr:hypothetical protein [archaeon]MBT4272449.1 hypothetical protein [archaeon]MBT4460547.1 hypothetical protein [archaeon]MBT4857863.1 hypothetical protein [archaeon]MBT5423122.1 hypothetical protein [archaeon]
MKLKQRHWILILLFLTFIISRSLISTKSSNFSDDNSYFVMRQIEHISTHGKPLHQDTLSYGGRTFIIMPLYYYLMGFMYKLFPSIIFLKIINNFFASSLIFSAYLISAKVIKNRRIALFCSVVASSLPIYINETLNRLNPYSIITPAAFLILWLFLELDENKLNYLIPLTIVFILSSSASLVLIVGLISYIVYSYFENKKIEKIHFEYASFFLLFFLWVSFIIFKEAFQTHGFVILFHNIKLSLESINLIGVPLILLGLYSVYIYSSKKKSIFMVLVISLFLSNILFIWLKLVPKNTLIFVGVYLVLLMGQTIKDFNSYLSSSKMSKYSTLIMGSLYALLVFSQIAPSFFLHEEVFSDRYLEGFEWLKENTEINSTILSVPIEGHLITYLSKRKNIADSQTLLVDYQKRTIEITGVYNSPFKTKILNFLNDYNTDYIILSDKLSSLNIKIQDTIFFSDPCFELIYNEEIKVFKRCEE